MPNVLPAPSTLEHRPHACCEVEVLWGVLRFARTSLLPGKSRICGTRWTSRHPRASARFCATLKFLHAPVLRRQAHSLSFQEVSGGTFGMYIALRPFVHFAMACGKWLNSRYLWVALPVRLLMAATAGGSKQVAGFGLRVRTSGLRLECPLVIVTNS